ncbi:hypothetical protein [Calderihabitans maritimus]|uniref:Uncharacterized protein n=1 Tax=Calderihabitans maritimus TaxID=1246530 RepID=A0A1Z5HUR0_9FIRM|nr:hypothetical protein [Calderihabitans maritimus]GAW93087.1 hypothetical protein Dtox_3836 [Calderihabitans maritimus]
MVDIINEKFNEEEVRREDTGQEEVQEKIKQDQTEQEQERPDIISVQSNPGQTTEGVAGSFDAGLKTVVLWIYNINQNGTANKFREELSQYFSRDKDGNVVLRDISPELIAQFLANLTTAKEIKLPDLGIRLILLIYNCNQNGASNSAEVAYAAKS